MSTITSLKELEEKKILEYGDIVEFTVKKEIIKYKVCCNHLWDKDWDKHKNNNRIFEILKINKKKIIEEAYKYKPIKYSEHNRYFSEYKIDDYPAITKLIKELYTIIKEKEIKYNKFTRFEIMEI